MIHRFLHWFGLYGGRVVTFKCEGVCFVGFQCATCDEINFAQKSVVQW